MKKYLLRIMMTVLILCAVFMAGCSHVNSPEGETPVDDDLGVGRVSAAGYAATAAGQSESQLLSAVFCEAGKSETGFRLVYAAAVKGDVGTLTVTRSAIAGGEAQNVKVCDTFYEGLRKGGRIYYYDAATQNMTTDSGKKGDCYWAVYAVELADETYYTTDISVEFSSDNLGVFGKQSKTQNLTAAVASELSIGLAVDGNGANLYQGEQLNLGITATAFGAVVTPTVSDSLDNASVTNGIFSSNVSGAHTITVEYKDPQYTAFSVKEERTINVGRKVLKNGLADKLTWKDPAGEYTTNDKQTLSYPAGNVLNTYLNVDPSTYYYAEAEFSCDRFKNGTQETVGAGWYGFGHFNPNDASGLRVYTTINMFDRRLRCSNTTSSIYTDSVYTLSNTTYEATEGNGAQRVGGNVNERFGVEFTNKYPENNAIEDGKFVKVGALRYGNLVYNFFDDQFVGAYKLPAWCADMPTQLGLYVNNYSKDDPTTIQNISFAGGQAVATAKLAALMEANRMREYEADFTLEFDYKNSGTEQLRVAVFSKEQNINATSHLEFGANYQDAKFEMGFVEYAARTGNFGTSKNFVTNVTEQGIASTLVNTNGYNPVCQPYFNDYNPGSVVYAPPAVNAERQFVPADKTAHYKLVREVAGEGEDKHNEYTMQISFQNAAGTTQTFSRKIVLAHAPNYLDYDNESVIVMIQIVGADGTVTNLSWS